MKTTSILLSKKLSRRTEEPMRRTSMVRKTREMMEGDTGEEVADSLEIETGLPPRKVMVATLDPSSPRRSQEESLKEVTMKIKIASKMPMPNLQEEAVKSPEEVEEEASVVEKLRLTMRMISPHCDEFVDSNQILSSGRYLTDLYL